MKRSLPPLKLSNSPLVVVLCQVRFSAVLAMAEYIPKIQDRLRLNGYPLNKSGTVHEFLVAPGAAASEQRPHWEVQTKEANSSIIVAPDFVVLQTSAYTSFEGFVEHLKLAVETVSEVVGGVLVQRIGLRYVDLLLPPEGISWRDWVKPGLHGLDAPVGLLSAPVELHQTVAKTTSGTMIVRMHQNRTAQILPPDLVQHSLKLRYEPPSAGKLVTLLDLDHFNTEQFDYESKRLLETSWHLHDVLDQVFRTQVATEKALTAWK